MEAKIKGLMLFTVALKKIKYLGINLTRHVYDLLAENYSMQSNQGSVSEETLFSLIGNLKISEGVRFLLIDL